MPLIYSAVARGAAVLAEYSVFAGNFNAVAKDYLGKAPGSPGSPGGSPSSSSSAGGQRSTHTVDNHVFSFLSDAGYNFVVVTDEAAGRTIPNAFLDRLRDDFVARYGEKGQTVKEGGLATYGRRLKELMEHAAHFPEEYSKVAGVQKKVDAVKNIMSENIEKVLSRGDKLDLLVDKTDNLMVEADRFVKSGRSLRRRMWWNDCKMKVVMLGVVFIALAAILLLFCFSNGGTRCIRKRGPDGAEPVPLEADDTLVSGVPALEPRPAHAPNSAAAKGAAAGDVGSVEVEGEVAHGAGVAGRRLLGELARGALVAAAAAHGL